MKPQNYELAYKQITEKFEEIRQKSPEKLNNRLKLSWSTWTFGLEDLEISVKRLAANHIEYIEIGGNHFGNDVGYDADETLRILNKYNIKCSGICGFFGDDNALSSNRFLVQQQAVDYIRREAEFCNKVDGKYLLIVPGNVGNARPYDATDVTRSINSLKRATKYLEQYHVQAAVEPIRSAEVAIINTIAEAKSYIAKIGHPNVQHINGDVFHMLSEEESVVQAIVNAGDFLINLHLTDSNRKGLGEGCLDIDMIIKTLYVIGFNEGNRFVTFEPLGPGGDSYEVMYSQHNPKLLDDIVKNSVDYFREREEQLLNQ